MKQLIKPTALKPGDTIATVSPSWGGAHTFPERYKSSKAQFEKTFDVKIIEAPNALKSEDEIYDNPQMRLDDLMWAFEKKEVKAILANVGGDDTIRLLPLMQAKHFEIIRNNPKIFLGMSDTTVNHFMCLKAGLSSFYSACLMFGYGENKGVPDYLIQNTKKTLFSNAPISTLPESKAYIIDRVDWSDLTAPARPWTPTTPWKYLGNTRTVQGRLIGGCIELLPFINGTSLWPQADDWEDTILFLETSEDRPTPTAVLYIMRNLGAQGILQKLKGILFARPGGEFLPEETSQKEEYIKTYPQYDEALLQACKEFGVNIPIVTNMDFGHTVPQAILPYGALCEINPSQKSVTILEAGVK